MPYEERPKYSQKEKAQIARLQSKKRKAAIESRGGDIDKIKRDALERAKAALERKRSESEGEDPALKVMEDLLQREIAAADEDKQMTLGANEAGSQDNAPPDTDSAEIPNEELHKVVTDAMRSDRESRAIEARERARERVRERARERAQQKRNMGEGQKISSPSIYDFDDVMTPENDSTSLTKDTDKGEVENPQPDNSQSDNPQQTVHIGPSIYDSAEDDEMTLEVVPTSPMKDTKYDSENEGENGATRTEFEELLRRRFAATLAPPEPGKNKISSAFDNAKVAVKKSLKSLRGKVSGKVSGMIDDGVSKYHKMTNRGNYLSPEENTYGKYSDAMDRDSEAMEEEVDPGKIRPHEGVLERILRRGGGGKKTKKPKRTQRYKKSKRTQRYKKPKKTKSKKAKKSKKKNRKMKSKRN